MPISSALVLIGALRDSPVVIDGEPYWDGGFMGNPPLYPLFYETRTPDTLIVQINPILRDDVPFTAREIVNRVNEITFNASLLRDLRTIDLIDRLIENGALSETEYRRIFLHMIDDGCREMMSFGASSKLNSEWAFLTHLRDIGRAAAEEFLAAGWRGALPPN